MSEPERGVASDGTLAVNNLRDAIGGHGQLPRKSGCRYAERFEFFGKHLAWMYGWTWHGVALPTIATA